MFRYHFPRNRCNIVECKVVITADIAQPVLKTKDVCLFTRRRILGCFSIEDDGAGLAVSIILVLFQYNMRRRTGRVACTIPF
jgi:hypothetical protein